MTWWFCSGVDDAVLVDRWREESDLWWWICGVVVDLCGGGDEVVIESIENVLAVFVVVFVVVVWRIGVCGGG
jgi:hypothetical protein